MHSIKLVELNKDNWYDCCELKLHDEQVQYMEPNAVSIAQSKYDLNLKPFGIEYEGKIVGFLMYNEEVEELDSHWIYRIMIDKDYQSKGIATTATKLMIDKMKLIPNCKQVAVGYHFQNEGARNLYAKLGFIDNGDRFGKEAAVVLKL
ncbi:GNAT family N-acetyltransferase [Mycoplasmatota bacterium WC44]